MMLNTDEPTPRKRRRWKRYVALALTLFIVILWWRVWQGGVSIGPAKANLSKIESSDSSSSAMSTSSSDGARLPAGRIVILTREPHPLIAKAAPLVRDELAQLGFVKEVTVVEQLPDGQPLPDLLITIDGVKIDESNSAIARTLKAKVRTRMITGADNGPVNYQDSLSPPIIRLEYAGTLEHQSKSIGDGVGGDRYQLTAPHIAKKIAESITKELKKFDEEKGVLPQLPRAFTGTFRPAPDLDAYAPTKSPPLIRGPGLFTHNESVWKFHDERDAKAVFDEAKQALAPAGWKGGDASVSDSMSYIRLTNGPRTLTIYTGGGSLREGDDPPSTAVGAGRKYTVHYVDRFSREDIDAALRSNASTPDTEMLMAFRHMLSPEMKRDLIARLEAGPNSAATCLYLAEHYESSDPAKSADYLRRARVLMPLMKDESSLRSRIDQLAKKLKIEKSSKQKLSLEALREMKIPQLEQGKPIEVTVGVDDPVLAYIPAKDEILLIGVQVNRSSSNKSSPFSVTETVSSGGSRTTGKTGLTTDSAGNVTGEGSTGYDGIRISWTATGTPDGKFKLTLKQLP